MDPEDPKVILYRIPSCAAVGGKGSLLSGRVVEQSFMLSMW